MSADALDFTDGNFDLIIAKFPAAAPAMEFYRRGYLLFGLSVSQQPRATPARLDEIARPVEAAIVDRIASTVHFVVCKNTGAWMAWPRRRGASGAT